MNWNANDNKYILKRLIVYILIAFAMFIISTFNVKAATGGPSGYNDIWVNNNRYNKSGSLNQYNGTTYYTITTNRENVDMIQIAIDNLSGTTIPNDITFNVVMYGTIYNPQVNINEYQSKSFGQSCTIINENHYNLSTDFTQYELNVKCEGISLNKNYMVSLSGGTFLYGGISPTITYIQTNNNEQLNQNIENVNNSINDDNITSSDADDLVNNEAFTDSTGLESVIQLPLNMVNSLSNTCQPISITIPFINYTGTIPCMSTIYSQHFGSLYTLLKVVINGFFVYRLLLKVYELVHSAKQPDEDKLEVIDL